MSQSPIINILTSGLPGNVTRPIYLEYDSRRRELDRIWANPENHYQVLQGYVSTVEALLAKSFIADSSLNSCIKSRKSKSEVQTEACTKSNKVNRFPP